MRIVELAEYHRDLERLFEQHQEALLDKDLELAAELFERHAAALLRHAAEEERVLIPRYDQLDEKERGGATELFTAEHDKLRDWVDRIRGLLDRLRADPSQLNRKLIRLLDTESTYKHQMEHHDLREERIMFPALDELLDDDERAAIAAELTWRLQA